jgi:hypothetical protein
MRLANRRGGYTAGLVLGLATVQPALARAATGDEPAGARRPGR